MAQLNSGINIQQGDNMASHHVDEQKVWDFFVALYDGNEYAAAGACGNMQHESGLYSDNAENSWNIRTGHTDEWLTDGINNGSISLAEFLQQSWYVNAYGFGYGLSQWTTSSRRTELWNRTIGNSLDIDDEDAQLAYIYWEWTDGYWSQYLNNMKNMQSVEDATRYYCSKYEVGRWSDNRLTQAQRFYDTYGGGGTGKKYIALNIIGNGVASVVPTMAYTSDQVALTCTPGTGDTLLDIDARLVSSGMSMALPVQTGTQYFPMPNDNLNILVTFSGITPPPPTIPAKKKGMPIWMYPIFRKC